MTNAQYPIPQYRISNKSPEPGPLSLICAMLALAVRDLASVRWGMDAAVTLNSPITAANLADLGLDPDYYTRRVRRLIGID